VAARTNEPEGWRCNDLPLRPPGSRKNRPKEVYISRSNLEDALHVERLKNNGFARRSGRGGRFAALARQHLFSQGPRGAMGK
jgi:hypothetical protein